MNKIVKITMIFILIAGNIYSLGRKQADPEPSISSQERIIPIQQIPAEQIAIPEQYKQYIQQEPADLSTDKSVEQPEQQTQSEQIVQIDQIIQPEPSNAERVMKAIAIAYPRQIDSVEFRNNDWAVLLRGTWYYYAGGRLLPENLLDNKENYSPHPFYFTYPPQLKEWEKPNREEAERFSNMTNNRRANPLRRSPYFFDTLWRAGSRNESYDRVKTMRFLGKSVTVHHLIMENLSLIEEEILNAAKTDRTIQTWINNINTLEGWNWRNIAETQSRSFHAYGLAVDFMPKSLGGKEQYWLWASRSRSDWWNIPYSSRYHPPEFIINTFEKYGFIWGGKWPFFDTMHFEYRPEVLYLINKPPEIRR